jgi:hypothetical protein
VAATDIEAWAEFPHHRRWFNKLELSLDLGYHCGPCGTSPERDGWFVVRPIYNLEGMGVGARKQFLRAEDNRSVEPGYFWCEWFEGAQHSVTYRWDGGWQPVSAWQGHLADGSLSRFVRWTRANWQRPLPKQFDVLADCGVINVEFVGDQIIEVHLRSSPDPDWGNEIIPIWADDPADVDLIAAFDDAGGFLEVPRVGFVIR